MLILDASATIASGGSASITLTTPYTTSNFDTSTITYASVSGTTETITASIPLGDVPAGTTLAVAYSGITADPECGSATPGHTFTPSDIGAYDMVIGITNNGGCTATATYTFAVTDIGSVPQAVIDLGVTVSVVHTLSE